MDALAQEQFDWREERQAVLNALMEIAGGVAKVFSELAASKILKDVVFERSGFESGEILWKLSSFAEPKNCHSSLAPQLHMQMQLCGACDVAFSMSFGTASTGNSCFSFEVVTILQVSSRP